MGQASYRCPKCQKTMEEGHIPDIGHDHVTPSAWSHGLAEPRRFFGGIKFESKEQIPLSAYRCPSCGYVELYAKSIDTGV
jgi:DNA-directed RNA polymerase subunit RPC12/RpoP